MSVYRQRFGELHQFLAGYFHQDWSRVFDWKHETPNFRAVVRHFKATNPPNFILKVRNQLEDLRRYDLDEAGLKQALGELGCNYFVDPETGTYRQWLDQTQLILDDPTEKGKVLMEIE